MRLPWGSELEVNRHELVGGEIFRQRIFDVAVSEAASRLLHAGDMAIDAGANLGYMTALFAACVGPRGTVHAFEPHPVVFARLARNAARARARGACAEIVLHECALGSTPGSATLEEEAFAFNEGMSRLVDPESPAAPEATRRPVRLTTIDETLAGGSCRLLKIDVEGAESAVIAGAASALERGAIEHVIFEDLDPAATGVASRLRDWGYEVFSLGYHLFGPALLDASTPGVDEAWESPSYLGTRRPDLARAALTPRGWRVLRGGFRGT